MVSIIRVRPLSVGEVMGGVGLILGLISGVVIYISGLIFVKGANTSAIGAPLFKTLIVIPLIAGVGMFIIGFLSGWAFNIAAKFFGGIELEGTR